MDVEVEARVRGYACDAVADCSPDRITAVSRFETGDRHAVFKVSRLGAAGGTGELVVRVSLQRGPAACAEARREARVLERAQGVAGPLLYDFRCDSRPWFDAPAMCMQFVAGEQRDLAEASPEDVARLGSLVGRVHGLPIDGLEEVVPATGTVAAYLHQRHADIVANVGTLRELLTAALRDRVERAVAVVDDRLAAARRDGSFATAEGLVLLHGDPGSGNILWTPAPVLIDWEYARAGDPADEVAYLFGQHDLTGPQREDFWRGYRTSAPAGVDVDDVVQRVGTWEPLTLLGSALWWLERSSRGAAGTGDPTTPRPPGYYLDHALARLDRLLRGCHR